MVAKSRKRAALKTGLIYIYNWTNLSIQFPDFFIPLQFRFR